MKLFSMDNPIMIILSKIADLMLINIFTLILCIPIVTAGAAFTALDYCCLKIRRDEETSILKMYFGSFKENFKQSTVLWLIMLVVFAIPTFFLLM